MTLLKTTADINQTLLLFIDVMKLVDLLLRFSPSVLSMTQVISGANVSVWVFVWKYEILSIEQWALPIKRWRHCLISAPLSSTRWSPGSTFKDQLWWSCICIWKPMLVIVRLQSRGQHHGTDYQQQSGHLWL